MSHQVKCDCEHCIECSAFFNIVKWLPEPERKWMTEFYELIDNERMDADVNKAILEGNWDSAVETLQEALVKAKEIRQQREATRSQLI